MALAKAAAPEAVGAAQARIPGRELSVIKVLRRISRALAARRGGPPRGCALPGGDQRVPQFSARGGGPGRERVLRETREKAPRRGLRRRKSIGRRFGTGGRSRGKPGRGLSVFKPLRGISRATAGDVSANEGDLRRAPPSTMLRMVPPPPRCRAGEERSGAAPPPWSESGMGRGTARERGGGGAPPARRSACRSDMRRLLLIRRSL